VGLAGSRTGLEACPSLLGDGFSRTRHPAVLVYRALLGPQAQNRLTGQGTEAKVRLRAPELPGQVSLAGKPHLRADNQ